MAPPKRPSSRKPTKSSGRPSARPAKRQPGVRKDRSRRVVILSRNAKLYSTRRLVAATRELGYPVEVVDTLGCSIVVESAHPTVVYKGRALADVEVVVPRIGASITSYGLAVVNQFESMDVPVLASAQAIGNSRDKLRSLQLLARHGIAVPRTVMARQGADIEGLVERVGGLPVIVKLTRGTQGIGVMIAHSQAEIGSILGTMWDLGQEIILQEFIAESQGRDVRVLVVGGQAVGAMRRVGKRGEFRSNLHRGGAGEPLTSLPDSYRQTAVSAARVVGLEVAGVDLLESDTGPKVMEINSSPGFEGLEEATGVDVAGLIMRHATQLAKAWRAGWRKPPTG